jgi:hypothetical protein
MAAGMARADIAGPGWSITDEGAVHVEWTDWNSFSAGYVYGPDEYSAYDQNGEENDPASVASYGMADAYSEENTYATDGTGVDGIQITANWDFSIWVPIYTGSDLDVQAPDLVQDVYLQITYWDDENDADWRQGWDLGVEAYGDGAVVQGAPVFQGETHDLDTGLITEAYSFTITDSADGADGFFVDFNGDPELSLEDNPAYVYSITADSISYAVPEPASVALLLLGGVMCRGLKRFRKS